MVRYDGMRSLSPARRQDNCREPPLIACQALNRWRPGRRLDAGWPLRRVRRTLAGTAAGRLCWLRMNEIFLIVVAAPGSGGGPFLLAARRGGRALPVGRRGHPPTRPRPTGARPAGRRRCGGAARRSAGLGDLRPQKKTPRPSLDTAVERVISAPRTLPCSGPGTNWSRAKAGHVARVPPTARRAVRGSSAGAAV